MPDIDILEWARKEIDPDFGELSPGSRWGQLVGALTDEVETLRINNAKLQKWNSEMVEKAASGGVLDGYREMGQRLAELESEKGKLRTALRGLVGVVERAIHLSQNHANFKLYAMDPVWEELNKSHTVIKGT